VQFQKKKEVSTHTLKRISMKRGNTIKMVKRDKKKKKRERGKKRRMRKILMQMMKTSMIEIS
jgi:hypothetical protein